MEFRSVFVSCEHGGNDVPTEYAGLFAGAEEVLKTHRGWDPGALAAARHFAGLFGVPVHFSTVTRLLVDLNRSLGSPTLFSEFSGRLSEEERETVLERYYTPYRQGTMEQVQKLIETGRGPVLHLSIHSFTPVFNGVVRRAEIGLLYDPASGLEKQFCHRVRARLRRSPMKWLVRSNYPYRGTGDGLILTMRRALTAGTYAGVNLELPQGLYMERRERWDRLIEETGEALLRCRAAVRRRRAGKVRTA